MWYAEKLMLKTFTPPPPLSFLLCPIFLCLVFDVHGLQFSCWSSACQPSYLIVHVLAFNCCEKFSCPIGMEKLVLGNCKSKNKQLWGCFLLFFCPCSSYCIRECLNTLICRVHLAVAFPSLFLVSFYFGRIGTLRGCKALMNIWLRLSALDGKTNVFAIKQLVLTPSFFLYIFVSRLSFANA